MNTIYYRDPATELHVGDALTVLRAMPSDSVQSVVTSPPQWGLRDYGTATFTGGDPGCRHTLGTTPHQRRATTEHKDSQRPVGRQKQCRRCGASCRDQQYGLEPTIGEYVQRMRDVASAISRVLTSTGTFWLNLRDSYSYHHNGTGRRETSGPKDSSLPRDPSVSHKSLLGIPWRVALGLQDDGWIVRNAIVWHKPNAIPDPASDRLSCRYEMLFLLVQQPDYYFDISSIREPYSPDRADHRRTHHGGTKPHTVPSSWRPGARGKNPGDVWSMSTRPMPEAHGAAFPVDLPLRCIAAGSPNDGRVLDPFSGAGTTGLAAVQLGCRYQGIDLRADYHDIFLRRLSQEAAGTRTDARTDEGRAA